MTDINQACKLLKQKPLNYVETGSLCPGLDYYMIQIILRGAYSKPYVAIAPMVFFICPQFESLQQYPDSIKCFIAGFHCSQIKKPPLSRRLCAQDWIRTSTPFRAPPPQSGLSTNFNTWAKKECKYKRYDETCKLLNRSVRLHYFFNTIRKVVPFPGSECLTKISPL